MEVISRINFNKKFNYFVVDIGTGLGNFLGYLNSYIPKENLIGVDNFSQISRENSSKYQKKTFGFDLVSNSELNKNSEHFIWIVGGLYISMIIEDINKFKPHYIFMETIYLGGIYLTEDLYEIDFFNELVIILKRKDKSSIQEHYIK